MNYDQYKQLQKEFKTGMFAGILLTITVLAIAVLIYTLSNLSIPQ